MDKRFNFAVYIAIVAGILDQISKWLLLREIALGAHKVINPFLNFVLVENKGITFGLLSQYDPKYTVYFFSLMSGIIIFLLGRWLWLTNSTLVATALGFILGGAIGNLVDRIRYGVVVDWIDVHVNDYHWYAFNIADSAIVAGVGMLLLDGLMRKR